MRDSIVILLVVVIAFLAVRAFGGIVTGDQIARIVPDISSMVERIWNTSTPVIETPASPVPPVSPVSVTAFAQCLARVGFTMYGTADCSACAIQKKYFGESFQFVPYIDCDAQKSLCDEKRITGFPTWEDKNGRKYKGAIVLSTLAQLSGCPAPTQ